MLPRAARLTTSADFQRVTRSGVRAGRSTVVVHAAPSKGSTGRVGFVVSKGVGNAVARNRVKRQLRHLAAAMLSTSAANADLVVRALPNAAGSALTEDLGSAWSAALVKLGRRAGATS